ncbi:hypothetical protein A33M_2557 [Rhodovulum sp. PH10]|uniref:SRPBCC family protein n=1 Tax=Rhodovulum sp. PH10 TaxID=1187851 RepID=UPI00027C1E29|nr:SRPBCC family protein [Rhodovulum sp. PH10]EJW12019.1 hypothetical protein A33M_2557 [Rhodovulum sp. PH10]
MANTGFDLVSDWELAAPPEAVWDVLMRPAEWPSWWPAVTRAEVIERGEPSGVGSYIRFAWKTSLPVPLAFNVRTTRIEPLALIEGVADGALTGTGRWRLAPTSAGTRVRYEWRVRLTAPGLRLVAPFAKSIFLRSHAEVMRSGRAGLARTLSRA